MLYFLVRNSGKSFAYRRRLWGTNLRRGARTAMAIVLTVFTLVGAKALAQAEDGARTAYVLVSEGSWLNIREKPKAHAPVVLRLPRGDALTLHSVSPSGWAEVSRAGDPGYCRAAYLCDDPPAPALRCLTTAGKLRVRVAPLGKVLRKLKAGVAVTVRGTLTDDAGDRWANIGSGFVLAAFLEPDGADSLP